jgi:hypothetical protein
LKRKGMKVRHPQKFSRVAALLCSLALCSGMFPGKADGWGNSAQRMIASHAVDTLPYDIRYFFVSQPPVHYRSRG